MPSYAFPPPPPTMTPTPTAEIDKILARLQEHKAAFASLGLDDRIALLESILDGVLEIAPEWAAAGQAAKGLSADAPNSGEEWLGGPVVTVRNIRLLQRALREIRDHGVPTVPGDSVSQRSDGRVVVQVFPTTTFDKLMWGGFTAEVWMEPGVTKDNLRENQARAYRQQDKSGKVSLVLGAGNVSSIGPMDALYKMFVENEVVLLKMNPVNEYLGPLFRRAFKAAVDKGYFDVVYGAGDVGAYCCQHPSVETIHITGSDATHDAIVWGPREGRDDRKKAGTPALTKPITSELGNVTPVMVVPGDWTDKELRFQAENVATMVANNGSFNCNAAKLLVLARDWPLRQRFLDEIRNVFRAMPNRKAYYPGARDRWQSFVTAHPEAERLSEDAPDTVPWTLIANLDADKSDEVCFRQEPFCAVLHEVSLPVKTAREFLPAAVQFCNDRVWGTLACMVLIDPRTRKDAANEAAFQQALDDLRYGGIGINHWAALNYGLVTPTWGAYPGHPLEDIQSGRGVVHNTWLFDRPQKSIVYGPFTMFPKPAWFATNKRTHRIGPKLTAFEANPSWMKLPGLVAQVVMG